MKLFNLFKKNLASNDLEMNVPTRELFIEESDVPGSQNIKNVDIHNLDKIYAFAEIDFEEKGYDDALINPDNSYSNDNIKLLKYDFYIKIKRAYKTYEDYIKDLEFHIETRKDAGLIDTVKLLDTELVKIKDSIEEVRKIEIEYNNETGLVERITLSYKRGFMRGLAAMSDQILDKNV